MSASVHRDRAIPQTSWRKGQAHARTARLPLHDVSASTGVFIGAAARLQKSEREKPHRGKRIRLSHHAPTQTPCNQTAIACAQTQHRLTAALIHTFAKTVGPGSTLTSIVKEHAACTAAAMAALRRSNTAGS